MIEAPKKAEVKSKPVPKSAAKKEVKKAEPVSTKVEVSTPQPVPKAETTPKPTAKKETVEEKISKIKNPFEVIDDEPEEEDKVDTFIKSYFRKNYLKVDGKKTAEKFIKYNLNLRVNELIIKVDAVYFSKNLQIQIF